MSTGADSLRRFGRSDVVRAASVGGHLGVELARAAPRAVRTRELAATASDAVVDAFEDLGPTFVKLGQLIASSPGLFPKPLATAARRTLDRVPPESAAHIAAVIERDLGAHPRELFATFDPDPLSSVSIAQVHAVTLTDGREAVVKVQRPGIRRRMNSDLRLLYQPARAAGRSKHLRMANPTAVIEDLHRVTNEALDFLRRALHGRPRPRLGARARYRSPDEHPSDQQRV